MTARAADAAVAGDTVHVRPGTYPERRELTTPGTADARITFQAEPSRSVVMHGLRLDGADFVTVRGFRVTHSEDFAEWDETLAIRVTDAASATDEREFDLVIEPGADSGCGCAVPGRRSTGAAGLVLLALALGLAGRRRARRNRPRPTAPRARRRRRSRSRRRNPPAAAAPGRS